jgi:hypothetical protein
VVAITLGTTAIAETIYVRQMHVEVEDYVEPSMGWVVMM